MENLLPQNMGSIINYLQCTEVAKLGTPSCSKQPSATDNDVRAVDPIDWSQPPPSWAVPPERHVHILNQSNLSWIRTCNRSMRDNHLAYAATTCS